MHLNNFEQFRKFKFKGVYSPGKHKLHLHVEDPLRRVVVLTVLKLISVCNTGNLSLRVYNAD